LFIDDSEQPVSYAIIQPPFTLKFREMPKSELQAYAAWFHEVMPARIAELTKAVKSTPGHEEWEADETPESLERLGRWFETQVETRKRSDEEMEEIRSSLKFPIDIPEEELTNKTFSLAMDIGMYFGKVILKNVPGTRWDQVLKPKNDADYGQPVVAGSGFDVLNPVRIAVTLAYGFAAKERSGSRLGELYEVWREELT
jgi:hypothetical protein